MAKPIPKPKSENALENFISQGEKKEFEAKLVNETEIVKKSLQLSKEVDDMLRLEVAHLRKGSSEIIEDALRFYFANKNKK